MDFEDRIRVELGKDRFLVFRLGEEVKAFVRGQKRTISVNKLTIKDSLFVDGKRIRVSKISTIQVKVEKKKMGNDV